MSASRITIWLSALSLLGLALSRPAALEAAVPPRDVQGSELLVKDYLAKLAAPVGEIQPLEEEELSRAFPGSLFFVVSYPPATTNLPKSLEPVNVFAVAPSGGISIINRAKLTALNVVVVPVTVIDPVVEIVVPAADPVAAEKVVKAELTALNVAVDLVTVINDPVLVKSFPGQTLFVVPSFDPQGKVLDPNSRNIMLVGADGKTQLFFGGNGQMGTWFRQAIGSSPSDPRIQEVVGVYTRLMQVAHPARKFGTPAAPQIIMNPGGTRTVLFTTPVTGPRGKHLTFKVRLLFGKHGRLAAWWYGIVPD
jgi:hypothetical protein